MFSARAKRRAAFTLIEVMLAVAILAMVGVSIYQFVELNVRAVQTSQETSAKDAALHGLMALLQTQMNGLQPAVKGALSGQGHTFNSAASDEMTWVSEAGNGLLTKDASGEFNVTLSLRPSQSSAKTLELGVQRVPTSEAALNRTQASSRGRSVSQANTNDWVRLLDDVAAFEVRYFDPDQQDWMQNWTDRARHPALIRVRVWKKIDNDPYEAVLTIPLKQLPK